MPEEKAGELYLEELGTRTWTEYWFHLDEGYLRYYKREGDLDPIAAIPCRGIVAKSVGKSRVGKHAFRLDVTKQADGRYKYVLAGEEEADSLEWLEALREHGCQVNLDKIRVRHGIVGFAAPPCWLRLPAPLADCWHPCPNHLSHHAIGLGR